MKYIHEINLENQLSTKIKNMQVDFRAYKAKPEWLNTKKY